WEALEAKENETGLLTIGAYNAKSATVTKSDVLVNVLFTVKEDAAGGGEIWLSNTTDDVAEAELINARFNAATDDVRRLGSVPSSYALEQNYPNPFNMDTEIIYELPEADYVTVTIYNSLGHEIRTLVSRNHEAGSYAVRWDGRNNSGFDITSGIYIVRLKTNRFTDSKKMLLVK
ncbi:MAG: FlgD immunoglobulin-like domain containing protein, partial [candidate division KSB1 bacterium]|nr:FlgD immunoglobulin-like domain containing protein [candidate division KSB1 bacterium]